MEGFKINIPQEYEWDIVENEHIQNLVGQAIDPHRQSLKQLMEKEHTRFWNNIHERLDYARARCKEYTEQIEDLCALNVGDEVTPEIRSIEKVRRPLLTIVRSVAADFDRVDEYIAHMQDKFEDELYRQTAALGMRCMNEDFDLQQLRISCIAVRTNGLVLDFTAGEGKGFEALFSYSKGSSVLRTPHIRCFVSERSMRQQKMAAVSISPETTGHNLQDRLIRAIHQSGTEMMDNYMSAHTVYYQNLWNKLPYARERYEVLQHEIAAAGRLGKSPEAKRLQKVANGFGHLVNSEAAKHLTLDSYLHHIHAGWNEYIEQIASSLAEKCIAKGMDDERTKIQEIQYAGNSLEFKLTEGDKEIQAACMLHGKMGVQHPPQIKTSVGDAVHLNVEQNVMKQNHLPSLQDVKPIKEEITVPDGLITKAKIVEYGEKLYITCHIAGERQSPQRIKPDEWKRYIEQSGNDKTGLVMAHFADEIRQALAGKSQESTMMGYRRK